MSSVILDPILNECLNTFTHTTKRVGDSNATQNIHLTPKALFAIFERKKRKG